MPMLRTADSLQLVSGRLAAVRQTPGGSVRRRRFSLIEVVLGLGLLAFGILTTMRLLPVSLNANRDSIAESYAADGVDEFLHSLATKLKDPAGDYGNWATQGLSLPTSKPTATEPSEQNWSEWKSDQTTTFWRGGSRNQFYKVERRTPGIPAADFAGVFRVWRDSVTFSSYAGGAWQESTASTDVAIAVHVEVSWPAFLPYARRKKSLYSLEVFKR